MKEKYLERLERMIQLVIEILIYPKNISMKQKLRKIALGSRLEFQ